ncbi:MAG: hypothetical protein ACJ8AW_31425 [Rhodopila sp.]
MSKPHPTEPPDRVDAAVARAHAEVARLADSIDALEKRVDALRALAEMPLQSVAVH